MIHEKDSLYWDDCTRKQARDVLQRNAVSGTLLTQAIKRFNDPSWSYGPHIYVIDTLTDKAARVDNQGCDTYSVKVSRRTGEQLLTELLSLVSGYGYGPQNSYLDKIVIID